MSTITRIAVAIAAVVALAGALFMLAPRGGVSGSAATPTRTSTPSPRPTSASTAVAQPTDIVLAPASQLPDPSGAALPADLIGRRYAQDPPEILDGRQLVLTLRAADDPHCLAMYEGRSTCFTVLWDPVKPNDPAARGSARIVDGKLVLELALVPNDPQCVGEAATYAYEDGGQTLRGIATSACTFPGFRELGATSAAPNPWVFNSITFD